jgi:hypothetical protein
VRGTLAFSFPEPVALEFDLAVSGLVSGTTLLTINGMPVSSSGIVQVTGTDFTVEIFVPKEAPGQVVGDIVVRAASATDADGDGVPDAEDECPASNVRPTVVIDGCNSGVTNLVFDDGCTIADLVTNCAEEAKNHGMFVSCVAHVSNDLKRTGAIGEKQKGALQRCAATASKP